MKQIHLFRKGFVIFLKGATFSDFFDNRLLNQIPSGIKIRFLLFWRIYFQLGSNLIKQWDGNPKDTGLWCTLFTKQAFTQNVSEMARPYGKAEWRGRMAKPSGHAGQRFHKARPSGEAGRRGQVARPGDDILIIIKGLDPFLSLNKSFSKITS